MSFQQRFSSENFTPEYLKRFAFLLGMCLIIVGSLNWLTLGLFGVNPLEKVFGPSIASFLYVLVGVSALAIMFDRDTYLPFLGPMVIPCSILKDREPPGATQSIQVNVTPKTKVLYWAADPAAENLKHLKSWKDAYAAYENAGVTTSNGEGVAVLKVSEPQAYTVPFKGKIESHVHYRVCGESGFMGRVQTVYGKVPEGFESPKTVADTAASTL